ncbi:streptomycin 6-kinase [Kribbella sp. VKM Ac-2571]|uniref:aminoglycoside phosphotransferase family protein n=1 Tax=Kribbella sp. VKM Ac-2571 TaxID=2512222 RepID=UPI0010F09B48|nr:aminoglycoside phosphotransferase family protein [Kribbella sp. VKM Ac-2571]TDO54163.1 streptomycin 6-kinase [Kribbella sp. VKM Ac-2571]
MIPEAFAQSTLAREGDAGAAWLAELPAIIEDLLERWDCTVDGEVAYGQVGVVVPVRGAALKVSFPHPGNDHEPDAFEAWGGRGAVKLYERDDARYAMLLERAHPSTLFEYDQDVVTIAGVLHRQLTIPAPDGLPRLSEQADGWAEALRKDAAELDHPLPAAVVDAGLAVVDELGRDQPEILIHGDFHPRNILSADREPWLAVDPKGYVGDPAYDAAIFLRTRAYHLFAGGGLLADDLLRQLRAELGQFAEAAGIDPEPISRWLQLIAVQSSFWGRRHGFGRARGGTHLDQILRLIDELAISWTD